MILTVLKARFYSCSTSTRWSMSLLCWSCWFHRCRLWRRPTIHGLQIVENIVEVQPAPIVEYVDPRTRVDATPVTTMTAAPTVFPTATVPIATQMVHGTKTFEILGTAAEIVECFRDRSASSRPPRFVTAPVLEAPPSVVEYVEFVPRCGVRDARTRGHVHTCCSRCRVCDVATMTAAPTVFPNCNSADRHRHVFAGDVRSASEHVRSGPLCCEIPELSAFFFCANIP